MKFHTLIISCAVLLLVPGIRCFAQSNSADAAHPAKTIISLDSSEPISLESENPKLNSFVTALRKASLNQRGFIVVYAGRQFCNSAEVDARGTLIKKYIEHRSIPPERIELVTEGYLNAPQVLLQIAENRDQLIFLESTPRNETQQKDCDEAKKNIKVGYSLNLLVCFIVFLSGIYWVLILEQKWNREYRFLYRAFVCWWLAWLMWVILWTVRLFAPTNQWYTIISLALTDLNALGWILVYFQMTRGNEFRIVNLFVLGIAFLFMLALGYAGLHLYFRSDPHLAAEIQESLGLCIGFVAVMVMGWAFSLRYDTNKVFVAGYIYGFVQPVAFKAFFHFDTEPSPNSQRLWVLTIIILAFLKIVWATAVTWYFLKKPDTTENLVKSSGPGMSNLFKGKVPWALQIVLLLSGFLILVWWKLPEFFTPFIRNIIVVLALPTALLGAAKGGRILISKLNNLLDEQPSEKERALKSDEGESA